MNQPTVPETNSALIKGFMDADDQALEALSRKRSLSLNVGEMRAVQGHFCALGRDPTEAELETLAQTWSEHCSHKTFKGRITYQSLGEGDVCPSRTYENLLKETIMQVTSDLAKPWCISVFSDNAGIIAFDKDIAIAFKVETHNHPSALEPYGGAGTGVGGVIRDILGVGLGAWPIANTDVFCFGPLDYPKDKLGSGVLSPLRVFKGVVAGVRDYGNKMGIPTVNGAICFDEGFLYNPLVYCGSVGLIPTSAVAKEVRPGDLVVVIGGRTGRDGIHGATFSSAELTQEIPPSVVQIGNPIIQKKFADVLMCARDARLYRAITDCGAGGFSSAIGELGADGGVRVHLEKAPLKYEGLAPWEIWVSESQERMVLAVPKECQIQLLELFSQEDVEATVLGEFTDSHTLEVFYKGAPVVNLGMDFLHKGCPKVEAQATWKPASPEITAFEEPSNLAEILLTILAMPTVASKEWVIRQYDHEVQARTILKPLVGRTKDGPSDACGLQISPDSLKGIVVGNGINPQYGKIDAYWMAASVIDEAVRNVVAVGGDPEHLALLDNFCWGDPKKPECLGSLVRAAQACADVAKAFETPFISGKDSFNNVYKDPHKDQPQSIPPTLLISSVAVVNDIRQLVTLDAKVSGNLLYIVGWTKEELGGSCYALARSMCLGSVPQVEGPTAKKIFDKIHQAIKKGWIRACHDCAEGGVAVAAAEMAFSGQLGVTIDISKVPLAGSLAENPRHDKVLFSESNSRFLCEVSPQDKEAFEKNMQGLPFGCIGQFSRLRLFSVTGKDQKEILHLACEELKSSWQGFSQSLDNNHEVRG